MKSLLLMCLVISAVIVASPPSEASAGEASPGATATSRAQTSGAERDAASELTVTLVDFPSSVGPQDSLRMTLEVTNKSQRPLGELRVLFLIYDSVNSRSRLRSTFDGSMGSLLGSDTIGAEGSLEPGSTRTITVEKPLAEISALRSSRTDGAYPVRIVVRANGLASDPIDTAMIFFTKPPLEPLAVSLIIPLHSPSIYGDGTHPDVVTSSSLERSLLPGGRLARILDAIEKKEFMQVPITLAPSGLLLDMLADLAGGYAKRVNGSVVRAGPEDPIPHLADQTLARLRLLTARPATRVIPMPYSAASLGALVEASLDDLAQAQVAETRNRMSAETGGVLDVESDGGWLLPIYRSLDERVLSALQHSGVNRIVLSPSSLREAPGALTRSAPVQVKSRTGPMLALIEDDGLKQILDPEAGPDPSRRTQPLISRQRFLADTATIMLERPAVKRAVVAVAPPDWAPQGPELEGMLGGLANAIWMRGATVDAVAEMASPSQPPASLANAEGRQNATAQPPPREYLKEYFGHLKDARRAIEKFAELAPPPEKLVDLQRRLLIAESADWWGSKASAEKGSKFASAIPLELARQTKSIQAPAAQVITLTSRTGVIPLSVVSGLEYPVDVVVELDSDKLEFPQGNRISLQKLEAPARTIEVTTIAQATGTFPLRVRVQTSKGTILSEANLTIRSTAYNVMAVSITAGAALFMFAWWIAAWLRRRAARPA